MPSLINRFLPVSLLAAVLPAATALADVRDNGNFFSPPAIQQANDIMSRIEQDHHKQFVVETFNGIPDDVKGQFDPSQKEQFFQHWANDRAKALRVNGVYVLVNRDPSYLQAEVGPETQQRAFTVEDRDRLKNGMLNDFKQKKFDDGLVQGANFVEKQMNAHLGTAGGAAANRAVGAPSGSSGSSGNTTNYPTAPQAQSHGFFGSVFGLIVLVGAVLIGISLIRRLVSRGQQGYGGGYGYGNPPMGGGVPPVPPQGGYGPGYGQPYNQGGGGGGGGFGRGLLGGLLGGAAGSYLYDKVAHPGQTGGGWTGGQAQAAPPPDNSGTNGIDTGTDVGGGDFSGSGGDFGGGGGADFGSSDSGGGSFDSGGGGGDAGGGGDSGGGSF